MEDNSEVYDVNYDYGEWENVYAYDQESAAEKFAEEYDDEHDLVDGGESVIVIRSPGSIEIKKCICTAEVDINYYASEQKEDDKKRKKD